MSQSTKQAPETQKWGDLTCCRWWREHKVATCPECKAWSDRMDQTARDERAFTGPRGEKP